MRLDELKKSWQAAAAHPIEREMSFDGDFLVLGAQTRLAKVGAPLDEPRLSALLTAAQGRMIAASSLRHVQRALAKKRDGDLVLALIHLALSGVSKLRHPKEDARRLFMADVMMREGVDPTAIAKSMISSAEGALEKYNPDQPRAPVGSPDGGQWTAGDSAAGPTDRQSRPPEGVQVTDASTTRGRELESDAAPNGASETGDSNGQSFEVAQVDLDQTCQAFIAANCKARILRAFPGQYLDCTLREVQAAAKAGDAGARCAKKLLERPEYRK